MGPRKIAAKKDGFSRGHGERDTLRNIPKIIVIPSEARRSDATEREVEGSCGLLFLTTDCSFNWLLRGNRLRPWRGRGLSLLRHIPCFILSSGSVQNGDQSVHRMDNIAPPWLLNLLVQLDTLPVVTFGVGIILARLIDIAKLACSLGARDSRPFSCR